MGRNKGRKKQRDDRKGLVRDNRIGQGPRFERSPNINRENATLQRYYDTLLGLDEEGREQFWSACRKDLPNSFRFCGSKGHALSVQNLLNRRYIPQLIGVEFDGQPVPPPQPVSWLPDTLAWSMSTPKNVIRKFPPFAAFQRFLVSETNVGNISRQELVSMIPPLLMDLRPGMVVLDMCASPGSKAAQLLEMLHTGEETRLRKALLSIVKENGSENNNDTAQAVEEGEDAAAGDVSADPSDDGRATGLLIANDSDYKRCHLLTHQLKRLGSPNMIVTQHDATMYPPLRIPNPRNPDQPRYLKFDRILADVPCSGDGTLRKNVELWRAWTPGRPLGLHITQVRILVRALQMLKVGGRVVYSTCSMNPVEDEAVIAAAIDRCGGLGNISIVDCKDELPGLVRRPGLTDWKIMDKAGRIWSRWQEVEHFKDASTDGVAPSKLVETMFPRESAGESGEGERLPLERCMRLYPHLQDTGGFFIAVLEKKAEFKAKPEETSAQAQAQAQAPTQTPTESAPVNGHKRSREEDGDTVDENGDGVPKRQKAEDTPATTAAETEQPTQPPPAQQHQQQQQGGGGNEKRKPDFPFEEPFKYLPPSNDTIQEVTAFYGISPRFPQDRYMVRNALSRASKTVYYTSALARDVLARNEGRGVRFVHAGVRIFVKQDSPSAEVCRWRIQSEGMALLQAYVRADRVVTLTRRETLRRLLVEMFPRTADGGWEALGEIGERVRDMPMGCYVMRVEPEVVPVASPDGTKADGGEGDSNVDAEAKDNDGESEPFAERMVIPLWKSFQSVNLMLPKEDRTAMLLRIFNDTTPLVNMGIQKKAKEEEEEKKPPAAAIGADADDSDFSDEVDGKDPVGEDVDMDAVVAEEPSVANGA